MHVCVFFITLILIMFLIGSESASGFKYAELEMSASG